MNLKAQRYTNKIHNNQYFKNNYVFSSRQPEIFLRQIFATFTGATNFLIFT